MHHSGRFSETSITRSPRFSPIALQRGGQAGDLPRGLGPAGRYPAAALLVPEERGVPAFARAREEHRDEIGEMFERAQSSLLGRRIGRPVMSGGEPSGDYRRGKTLRQPVPMASPTSRNHRAAADRPARARSVSAAPALHRPARCRAGSGSPRRGCGHRPLRADPIPPTEISGSAPAGRGAEIGQPLPRQRRERRAGKPARLAGIAPIAAPGAKSSCWRRSARRCDDRSRRARCHRSSPDRDRARP